MSRLEYIIYRVFLVIEIGLFGYLIGAVLSGITWSIFLACILNSLAVAVSLKGINKEEAIVV